MVVRIQARLQLLKLSGREGRSFRVLDYDTVPDALNELDPLGYGEVEEVGSGPAHWISIGRLFFGG